MPNVRSISPYAGMTVKIKDDVSPDPSTRQTLAGQNFVVEDWWQNVSGHSWMNSDGNAAALAYAFRIGMTSGRVPPDNEVLYGKVGMLGYLFHVTELILPEVS